MNLLYLVAVEDSLGDMQSVGQALVWGVGSASVGCGGRWCGVWGALVECATGAGVGCGEP